MPLVADDRDPDQIIRDQQDRIEELESGPEDGSPEAERGNHIRQGIREGKRECADALRSLVSIIG